MKLWIKILLAVSITINIAVFSIAGLKTLERNNDRKVLREIRRKDKKEWQRMRKCHRYYQEFRGDFFDELLKDEFNEAKLDSLLKKMVEQKSTIEHEMGKKAINERKNKDLTEFKKTFRFFKKLDKKHHKRRLPWKNY